MLYKAFLLAQPCIKLARPYVREYWVVSVPLLLSMLSSALLGGRFDAKWYIKLKKPSICPPNWVFPVVWTALYLQIGYSIHLLMEASSWNVRLIWPQASALIINLLYNYSWSHVFFKKREISRALNIAGVIALSGMAAAALVYQVSKQAAYHLVPYCVWCTFAFYLNYRFKVENKDSSKKNK